MRWLRRLVRTLRPSADRAGVDEEIRLHLQMEAEDLERQGLSPDEARRRAGVAFGGVERVRIEAHEVRRLPWLHDLGPDLRHAIRQIRRSPAFALVVSGTLALAIGASLAIFTLIDRIVLRPIDVTHASRLLVPQRVARAGGTRVSESWTNTWRWADYERIAAAPSLEAVAAFRRHRLLVATDAAAPETELVALFVTASYFPTLGLTPPLGRTFQATDEPEGAPPAAMLSHAFWHTQFHSDPGVVGRTVRLNGLPVEIVGVAPPTFALAAPGETVPGLLLPLGTWSHIVELEQAHVRSRNGLPPATSRPSLTGAALSLVARAQSDASLAHVRTEIAALLPADLRPEVLSLREAMLPFESRADLFLFLALLAVAAGITVAIGATNLTTLLLARVDERRPELALRAALGARRSRLARQLAVECAVPTAIGGVAALVVAQWIVQGFSAFALPGGIAIGSLREWADARTLLFSAGLTAMVALLIGLGPMLRATRVGLAAEVQRQRAAPGPGATRVLLGLQVALCVVLVATAGLFTRSLAAALATDVGFDARGLLSVTIAAPPSWAADVEGFRRHNQAIDVLLDRVRGMPDVQAATRGPMPLAEGSQLSSLNIRVDGLAIDAAIPLEVVIVGEDYFSTLRQAPVAGRDFTAFDDERVGLVNESAARLFWGGGVPLGSTLEFLRYPPASALGLPGPTDQASIVGVVQDATLTTLGERHRPALYVLDPQGGVLPRRMMSTPEGRVRLMVRVQGSRASWIASLRRAAGDLGLSIDDITTIEDAIHTLTMPQRLGRALLSGLGLTALAVTLVGLYGLVSGLVTRRAKDIAVRLALGASSREAVSAAMRPALSLVLAGLILGGAATWWAGRAVERFLYGISGSDPATLAVALLLLAATASVAALIPAMRVLRIDPVQALRAE